MDIVVTIFEVVLVAVLFVYCAKSLRRHIIYLRYKNTDSLKQKHRVFYFALSQSLPTNYKIICNVDVDDVIRLLNAKTKFFEYVEIHDKFSKIKKHNVDFIILNNKNRVICGIDLEDIKVKGVPSLFEVENDVCMLAISLNLKMFVYQVSNSYNLKHILDYLKK